MKLTLHRCNGPDDMRRFVDFPYRLGRGFPHWVRPPRIQMKKTLNPAKHPIFNHGNVSYALALRGTRVVGRIAAIDDTEHLSRYDDQSLHFGFFDCEDDPEAARLLCDWVAAEGRTMGRRVLRGPFNPSVHDEIGVQIDAFEEPNFLLIPGNPPYYPALMAAAGFDKCVDLYCYGLPIDDMSPRVIARAEKVRARYDLTVRTPTKRSIRADIGRLQEVYNAAWRENWPWRPAQPDEFTYIVESLLEVADLRYVQIIEDKAGAIVGFSIAIPNLNEVFARMPDGLLFPTGLAKLLWYGRKDAVKTMRVIAMGVVEGWRNRGIDIIFHARQHAVAKKAGVRYVELSQVLETNEMMKRTAKLVGGEVRMTHRIYEKQL